jgi:hypothetical protein
MKRCNFALALALIAFVASDSHAYTGEAFVVCNLDPDGDNWLALKEGPSSKSKRLKKLGPNTPLATTASFPKGKWREVIVLKGFNEGDGFGPSGWVYVDYICPYLGPQTVIP